MTIKNGVSIWEGVHLADDVFVGPNAVFTNDKYPSSLKAPRSLEKTFIKKGASIGANATILCGITIGRFSVVGAGAVVTTNVSDYSIVVGNPARPQGFVSRERNLNRIKKKSRRSPKKQAKI